MIVMIGRRDGGHEGKQGGGFAEGKKEGGEQEGGDGYCLSMKC